MSALNVYQLKNIAIVNRRIGAKFFLFNGIINKISVEELYSSWAYQGGGLGLGGWAQKYLSKKDTPYIFVSIECTALVSNQNNYLRSNATLSGG